MHFWILMGKCIIQSVAVKRIIFIALCLTGITGSASAYQVYLSCPESVQAGLLLNCSVDSNLPAGTAFDVVFYKSVYRAAPFSRMSFVIGEDHATMEQSFDTKGLPGGPCKVEVRFDGPEAGKLSSDSITIQVPDIINRTSEITITAPVSQALNEALRIEGSITKLGNKGVDIGVKGPDGFVSGPRYTSTNVDFRSGAGVFTRRVAVTLPGTYEVYFRDAEGYIGMKTFDVIASTTPSPAAVPETSDTTPRPTTIAPASLPTTNKSTLSLVPVVAALAGIGLLALSSARKH
jgi:hypothetical protein